MSITTAADAPPARAAARGTPALYWILPAAVFLAVSGAALSRKPLFRDEAATYLFSRMPLGQLLDATRHVDGAFLPYYALMHLTPGATAHPVALRVWSLLAATATVAVVAAVAGRLWGRWAGLATGLVLCGNGAFLTAADTARPAALAALCCAVATLILVRARDHRPTPGEVVGYGASIALAGLFTVFSLLILLAHLVLALAWFARSAPRRIAAFGVAAAAGLACVVPLLVSADGQRAQISWIRQRSAVDGLRVVLLQSGYAHRPESLVLVSALVVVAIGCAVTPRSTATHLLGPAITFVPAGGLWVASQLVQPLEIPRYLVSGPMGSALVVGGAVHVATRGVAHLAARRMSPVAAVAAPAVAVALLAVSLMAQLPQLRPRYDRASLDDFPGLVTRLEHGLRPGEHVIFTQNFGSQGRVAGIALYAGDADLTRTLSREARDGVPLLLNRVVVHDDPLRTAQATTPAGPVVVITFDPHHGSAADDSITFWTSRLIDEGCTPTHRRVPVVLRAAGASRWTCRNPVHDGTAPLPSRRGGARATHHHQ